MATRFAMQPSQFDILLYCTGNLSSSTHFNEKNENVPKSSSVMQFVIFSFCMDRLTLSVTGPDEPQNVVS